MWLQWLLVFAAPVAAVRAVASAVIALVVGCYGCVSTLKKCETVRALVPSGAVCAGSFAQIALAASKTLAMLVSYKLSLLARAP